ncbi:MAG TPA: sulfite exporter TauE/SafE family protein, partial [Nitrococcus sp.]|nr:sulfite exporter TauE/SafE family protein [Nitrococcus sp.]
AAIGAYLTAWMSESVLSVLFGLLLLFAALSTFRKRIDTLSDPDPKGWARKLHLYGSYPSAVDERTRYAARNVMSGWMVMSLAGLMSGLLGVGAGAVKVLAMDQIMALPYKVSTTTSNLIVGITAAVGLGIYLNHGYLDAVVATPVVLGVVAGALIGARVLVRAPSRMLRHVFTAVIVFFGCMMLRQGLKSWL